MTHESTSAPRASVVSSPLTDVLDHAHARLLAGESTQGIDDLASALTALRRTTSDEARRSSVVPTCQAHPVAARLHPCPSTARASQKPCGYAGDAVMLGSLYDQVTPDETSPTGREVFFHTTGHPTGRSVVFRRAQLARLIDETAARVERPRILAVACGHLRELALSTAYRAGQLGEVVALDQDPASLAVVAATYPPPGVRPVASSVRDLLGRSDLGMFDLIYAAGLSGYLPSPFAAALTAHLVHALHPGGVLMYANFMPGNDGQGYMEAFMDGRLIVRTPDETLALAEALPTPAPRRADVDPFGHVAYVVVRRPMPVSAGP